jgi:hypothetical protein
MSADTPETKYETGHSTHLPGDVALTDHAIHRFAERTPHDCAVGIVEAWRKGEDIEHPQVARSPNDSRDPERVRVYTHGDERGSQTWGVVFLVVQEATPEHERPPTHTCDRVVCTVMDVGGFDHGPSRAYLHSHGPHGGGGRA